jgi:hypothetical protein
MNILSPERLARLSTRNPWLVAASWPVAGVHRHRRETSRVTIFASPLSPPKD